MVRIVKPSVLQKASTATKLTDIGLKKVENLLFPKKINIEFGAKKAFNNIDEGKVSDLNTLSTVLQSM